MPRLPDVKAVQLTLLDCFSAAAAAADSPRSWKIGPDGRSNAGLLVPRMELLVVYTCNHSSTHSYHISPLEPSPQNVCRMRFTSLLCVSPPPLLAGLSGDRPSSSGSRTIVNPVCAGLVKNGIHEGLFNSPKWWNSNLQHMLNLPDRLAGDLIDV